MSDAVARLEQAIFADRDDEELYLVLADELQRAGDPRGELIVMQQRIQETDDKLARRELQRACDRFIAEHDLLGPLRDYPPYGRSRKADVTWRYGFIRCLELELTGVSGAEAQAELEDILRHPSSPFITMMVLGRAPTVGTAQASFQPLIDAMVATGKPTAVRSLRIGRHAGRTEQRGTFAGRIGDLSPVVHRLTKLVVEANRVRVGRLALPALVELEIDVLVIDEDDAAELLAIQCPRLKRVSISCDNTAGGNPALEQRLRDRLGCTIKVRGHPSGYA